jgi:PAS domain S-box-containing protein
MIQTQQRVVWVIDDDETVLILAAEVLAAAGLQVRTFSDAAVALATLPAEWPDLVVVDLLMPGMDGFEFCSQLRRLPQGALLPVLVTTSLDDNASINQAYQVGATNFALKPINWTVEVQRLHYLLKSADLARAARQNEQEMRLAKEDWERTFDAIVDVVAVLDTSMNILRANKAAQALVGCAQEALIGRPCSDLLCSRDGKCPNCPVPAVFATNHPATSEVTCVPCGKSFEVTVSPVTDQNGRISHLVHVARDLSERRKLEAELRHAQKMEAVGTLAGGIAHDFNNLLMVIQCQTEALIMNPDEPGEEMQAILEATRRGSVLARQLLLFSRKGAAISQKQAVDLNVLVLNVIRMLEKGLDKSVNLRRNLADGLGLVNANAEQIEQVLMNLAVNAAHAMSGGGELSFRTENLKVTPEFARQHPILKPGDYVTLSVSDTGHGMDKQTMDRIYEPFYTTKKVGEGTGLGLSVAFAIVQDHAGFINCESELDQGTTFTIYLPAVSLDAAGPLLASPGQLPLQRGSETILVVDDEKQICALLQRMLTKLGYTVLTALDGATALEIYATAERRPQAVILDLGMPQMSGWDCLRALRQLDPQARILIATGYGGDNVETEAHKYGAAAVMAKPYKMAELSQILRAIMAPPAPRP